MYKTPMGVLYTVMFNSVMIKPSPKFKAPLGTSDPIHIAEMS